MTFSPKPPLMSNVSSRRSYGKLGFISQRVHFLESKSSRSSHRPRIPRILPNSALSGRANGESPPRVGNGGPRLGSLCILGNARGTQASSPSSRYIAAANGCLLIMVIAESHQVFVTAPNWGGERPATAAVCNRSPACVNCVCCVRLLIPK